MITVPQADVLQWDGLITTLARQRSRMIGMDYDDLRQEGFVAVITSYAMGSVPTEQIIVNALRRYMRAVREGRTISYEPEISVLQSVSL